MKRLIVQCLSALLLVCAGGVRAQECLQREWSADIDGQAFFMAFHPHTLGQPEERLHGYFHERQALTDHLLVHDPVQADVWQVLDPQGQASGQFKLTCQGTVLTGQWRSRDGQSIRSIRAEPSRIEGDRLARALERLGTLTPDQVQRGAVGGHPHETFWMKGFDEVKGLRLIGSEPGLARINGVLRQKYLESLAGYLDCRVWGRLERGGDPQWGEGVAWRPSQWTSALLVVNEDGGGYCDGAHPYFWSGAASYDLHSGEQEDVKSWLVDALGDEIAATSVLGKRLLRLYQQQPPRKRRDCRYAIEFKGHGVWATASGVAFQPTAPYPDTACIKPVVLPYAEMAPYLTAHGRDRVAHLRGR